MLVIKAFVFDAYTIFTKQVWLPSCLGPLILQNQVSAWHSPVDRTPRTHPQLWPGAWQEVGEPVHDGGGHRQGSYVLVDLLQLTHYSAGHQLQHVMGKMEGDCCPLKEGARWSMRERRRKDALKKKSKENKSQSIISRAEFSEPLPLCDWPPSRARYSSGLPSAGWERVQSPLCWTRQSFPDRLTATAGPEKTQRTIILSHVIRQTASSAKISLPFQT